MRKLLRKILFASLAALLLVSPAKAQFYSIGADPGPGKWHQIRTDNYRVVYPAGLDSLAGVYAKYLEQVRIPVGGSLGYIPNQSYRKQLPVILHPYTSSSNGMVVWAPRRMELYTTPDPFNPEATVWPLQLAIHESRHVAQMQPYASKPFWGKIILGDLIPSVMAGICVGPAGMEGDAVVAETALTAAGRGRAADFLEYQRACFAEGEMRNYWQWRFGSQKKYTPDYYRLGYMSAAGLRDIYGFDKWPYHSLSKALPRSFPAIAEKFAEQWEAEAQARAPFMPEERLTKPGRLFTEYSYLVGTTDGLYALKSSLDEMPYIVKVSPEGNVEKLKMSSSSISRLKYNSADGKLYWSEIVRDPRWELRSFSIIRSYDLKTGKVDDLTANSRYFNPSVSEDGSRLAACLYEENGTYSVVVLDAKTGNELSRFRSPDGVQPIETAWIGDDIYVSVLDTKGMTVCLADGCKPVFEERSAKIKELGTNEGKLIFVSDRDGVDELYSYDLEKGKMFRLTNSRQGSTNHAFSGGDLYYTTLSSADRSVRRTAVGDLPVEEVDPGQTFTYPLAEYLSSEEPFSINYDKEVNVGKPERYSRLGHSFKFHSWAPAYINPDVIESLSFGTIFQDCGLGATAFFQNELSTLSGTIALSAWTPAGGFLPEAHAKLAYGGLFPKFEASANVSTSSASTTLIRFDEKKQSYKANIFFNNLPAVDAQFRVYVPFGTSKGGWSRGFVPQVGWYICNSGTIYQDVAAYNSTLTLSARAYLIQNIPASCLYPRWGIGVEAGYNTSPGLTHLYISNLYGYIYGYVPGIVRTHGIRLSALAETLTGPGPLVHPFANVAPRGCPELKSEIARYKHHGKFTFDYALPFGAVDWGGLGHLAYVRNFEFTAHYDLSYFMSSKEQGTMSSAGADLVVKLGNLLWLPYATRIGLSYNYNFGDLEARKHYFGLIFSVDF